MSLLERIWRATQRGWQMLGCPHVRRERGLPWQRAGNYQSYMVRFWRTNSTVPWRAAVVDPHHHAIRYFASREALYAFLDAQIDDQHRQSEQS